MIGGFRLDGELITMPWDALRAGRGLFQLSEQLADDSYDEEERVFATLQTATLIGSLVGERHHRPVLDIDVELNDQNRVELARWLQQTLGGARTAEQWLTDPIAMLVPSSTSGHHHLYVNATVGHRKYMEMLMSGFVHGWIESGYAVASIRRGETHVRLPWVSKQDRLDEAPPPERVRPAEPF